MIRFSANGLGAATRRHILLRMNHRRCAPIVAGLMFLIGGIAAAEHGEGRHFLSHGPGAAAAAMGEAFTAQSKDLSAIYFNPAGLSGQSGAVATEHTPVFGGGRYNFLGLHLPSKIGSFGLGIIQYATDGIEGRANLGDEPTELSATQTCYLLPYSVRFGNTSVGSAMKFVSMDLGGAKATGWGADLGVLHRKSLNDALFLYRPTWQWGISAKNVRETEFTFIEERERFEREWSAGTSLSAGVRPRYKKGNAEASRDKIALAIDVAKTKHGAFQPRLGMEYAWAGRWPIRLGYRGLWTAGVGYGGEGRAISLDYSVALTGLGPQHRIGFTYRFIGKQKPNVNLAEYRAYLRAERDIERWRDRMIEEGRKHLTQRRYAEGETAYELATLLDSKSVEAAEGLARSREAFTAQNQLASRSPKSWAVTESPIKDDPTKAAQRLFEEARIDLLDNNMNSAYQKLLRAESLAPNSPDIVKERKDLESLAPRRSKEAAMAETLLYRQSLLRQLSGDPESAAQRLTELLTQNPLHPDGTKLRLFWTKHHIMEEER